MNEWVTRRLCLGESASLLKDSDAARNKNVANGSQQTPHIKTFGTGTGSQGVQR